MVMRDTAKMPLNELDPGSYFIHGNSLYISLKFYINGNIECVALENHSTTTHTEFFKPETIVYPIKLEEIFYSYV